MPGASGPHPQGSMQIASDLVAQLGDVRATTKAIQSELREAKRELRTLAKEGRSATPELMQRIDRAERLKADMVTLRRQQTEAKHAQQQIAQGVAETRATGRAIRWFMSAQAIRALFAGNMLDPGMISAFVFGMSEHLQAHAARIFGEKSRMTRFARGFAAVAPTFTEAAASWIRAFRIMRDDRNASQKMGVMAEKGLISNEELAYWNRLNESQLSLSMTQPVEEYGATRRLIQQFAKLKGTEREKVLERFHEKLRLAYDAAYAEDYTLNSRSHRLRKSHFEALLNAAGPLKALDAAVSERVQQEENRLGRRLTKKEREEELTRQLWTVMQDPGWKLGLENPNSWKSWVSPEMIEVLKDEIAIAITSQMERAEARKTATQLRAEAVQRFREREVAVMQDLQFQRARMRVAMDGRIGD